MTDDNILLKNDISVYRERLGLTQGELALKCGVRGIFRTRPAGAGRLEKEVLT